MLKINNQSILNARDLRENFSPWEVYGQLDEVVAFARIHCVKLSTLLQNKTESTINTAGYKAASYINKDLWLHIAEAAAIPSKWKYSATCVKACIQDIVKNFFDVKTMTEARQKVLEQEYTDTAVEQKLNHIISNGELKGTPEDIRAAVVLLALCELAEVDALEQSFCRWDTKPASDKNPKRDSKSDRHKNRTPSAEASQLNAEYLPKVSVLTLAARGAPYLFYYYDQDVLENGKTIQATRIEASMGSDRARNLLIHLVHPTTKQIVTSVTINVGEYLDCIAVDGKIIKFHPTMSISQNLFITRNPEAQGFDVVPFGSAPWTIAIDRDSAKSITCFSAGDDSEQGFLFVASGKVITNFYKPCEDFFVRMEMQMITENIVDVQITPEGYQLLTETGTVISDNPKQNGKNGLVSLTEHNCTHSVKSDNHDSISEIVMNSEKSSLAIKDMNGKTTVIFADDPDKSFRILSNGKIELL